MKEHDMEHRRVGDLMYRLTADFVLPNGYSQRVEASTVYVPEVIEQAAGDMRRYIAERTMESLMREAQQWIDQGYVLDRQESQVFRWSELRRWEAYNPE